MKARLQRNEDENYTETLKLRSQMLKRTSSSMELFRTRPTDIYNWPTGVYLIRRHKYINSNYRLIK